MKKKVFNYMLLAVMMLGLGITFTSCDDKLTEEEKQQKQEQENDRQFLLTSEFWQVVGQLSTAEVLPDDWQNTTFEPGIGQASDKSTTTRIVLTNEAEAAAESFENLTGVELNGLTAYEWKRDFGSLTYKQLNDGTAWAEVEVDIKQMPGLKRIVYCTPEQQGLNASVPGTPYYRFGDVIKKNNNGVWEYWVCVRPCFGPEKKGDMHWMCLGSLPDSHIETYTYTKQNRQWWWHKSLTTDDEHIKNLSEMTFAILNPDKWADYYESNQKKNMFHDFSYENISYHNRYFWQLVQMAWNTKLPSEDNKTVCELLFHRTMGEVQDDEQLNFFYGSASGPSWRTWYMSMKTASVNLRTKDINNLKFRELVKQTVSKSCENDIAFDIREYSNWGRPNNSNFFKSNFYIYPLRCATGKQLLGTQPNCYQPMDGTNGIQDVYVFNKRYNQGTGSTTNMKVFQNKDIEEAKSRALIEELDARGRFYGYSFWRFGDVVRVKNDGSLWFCIQPSGYQDGSEEYADDFERAKFRPSNKSFFISLTPEAFSGDDQHRTNLPSHDEAISIGVLLESARKLLPGVETPDAKNEMTIANENLKKYAGIDLVKLMVLRDSTHNENPPEETAKLNHVHVYCSNVAYSSSSTTNQPLVRVIYSNAGRSRAGGKINYHDRWMEYIVWDRYEHGNKETMYMQDLASTDKVAMYASADRWVTLPWYSWGNVGLKPEEISESNYEHQQPRSTAYDNVKCSDFDWDKNKLDFKNPEYRSMYNEPVIFCRLMAVHDIGTQETISTNGIEFEVVNLVKKTESTPNVNSRENGLLGGSIILGLNTSLRSLYFYNGELTSGHLLGE